MKLEGRARIRWQPPSLLAAARYSLLAAPNQPSQTYACRAQAQIVLCIVGHRKSAHVQHALDKVHCEKGRSDQSDGTAG